MSRLLSAGGSANRTRCGEPFYDASVSPRGVSESILIQIWVLRFAYMQLGVSSGTAFFLLLGSLLGSYINIPIATLGEEAMVTEREVTYFGMNYIVPELVQPSEVILAVNVGGAIIPTILSIYLLAKNGLWDAAVNCIFVARR